MNSQPAGSPVHVKPDLKSQGNTIKGPLTGRDVKPVRKEIEKSDKKAPGAFRTISEVSEELAVQQHVLRFWETKFSQIRPLKRGGGRRYYRPEDLVLLKKIHHLLYTEGYTIKGVQKLLKEKGKAFVLQEEMSAPESNNSEALSRQKTVQASVQGTLAVGMSASQKAVLQAMLGELKEIRKLVKPD